MADTTTSIGLGFTPAAVARAQARLKEAQHEGRAIDPEVVDWLGDQAEVLLSMAAAHFALLEGCAGTRVTVVDQVSGHVTTHVIENDYRLVVDGTCQIADIEARDDGATHVVTVTGRAVAPEIQAYRSLGS